MAQEWKVTGTYFEACKRDVACPCVFLSPPTKKSGSWFARLSEYYDARFGHGWKNKDKKFWKEFDETYKVSKDEIEKLL